jgi:UDP-N-acetylglucosamine 2-epimerase (non-hydrolysing)
MKMKFKIILVVGARPNFMKAAPIYMALKKHKRFRTILVHTGQHYDRDMSDVFFRDLGMPKPDIHLGVGSGTHSEQTAKVMIGFEKVLVREDPDLVIVVGDVNSTIACSLATVKYRCTRKDGSGRACSTNKPLIAHVEAGLRSFDRTMPEEINRLLTDQISDYLFTTCRDADKNLMREGIPKNKIFFVGNVMIDTLTRMMKVIKTLTLPTPFERERGCFKKESKVGKYALVTLHRPSNVDEPKTIRGIMSALRQIGKIVPVIFPVHPRTAKLLKTKSGAFFDLSSPDLIRRSKRMDSPVKPGNDKNEPGNKRNGIIFTKPLGYLEFMGLMANAALVLTDSGGIQEETTILGVPCLTLRNNTERPITITQGTNKLVGTDPKKILKESIKIVSSKQYVVRGNKKPKRRERQNRQKRPALWDGKAALRIVKILKMVAAQRDRII